MLLLHSERSLLQRHQTHPSATSSYYYAAVVGIAPNYTSCKASNTVLQHGLVGECRSVLCSALGSPAAPLSDRGCISIGQAMVTNPGHCHCSGRNRFSTICQSCGSHNGVNHAVQHRAILGTSGLLPNSRYGRNSSIQSSLNGIGSYDAGDAAVSTLVANTEASASKPGTTEEAEAREASNSSSSSNSSSHDSVLCSSNGLTLSTSDAADDLCQIDETDTSGQGSEVQQQTQQQQQRNNRAHYSSSSSGSSSYTPGSYQEEPEDPFLNWWKNRDDLITLAYAVAMGGVVATSVFVFDVSIQYVHDLPDILAEVHIGGGRATGLVIGDTAIPFRCIMPIGAGFIVAYLQRWGFSPGLKFLTRAIEGVVDDKKNAALPTSYWQVFRRAAASVITLGSGASLGPEAPSVELGANTAAVFAPKHLSKRRQRMLVAAGAAAGMTCSKTFAQQLVSGHCCVIKEDAFHSTLLWLVVEDLPAVVQPVLQC
eukprot:GHRR01009643.1.p1 GENE.GHRR01009643.1~~GHRR01009643.1.p1  ORF type:complete len:483 (+),score=176.43 GHRR01009643.1:230-1678(+)